MAKKQAPKRAAAKKTARRATPRKATAARKVPPMMPGAMTPAPGAALMGPPTGRG
jgi:hypothetical protein